MNKKVVWSFIFILLLGVITACGKDPDYTTSGGTAQGSFGLNMNVPNFESTVSQQKGIIFIPHTPETGAIIHFETKKYLIDPQKSNSAPMQLVRKLFRHDVDVRPYEQNSAGTFYRARFIGKFNMDSIILQFLQVH